MTFGSPLRWNVGAQVAAIVVVAVLLVAVGFASHAQGVVEASYECPVLDGDPGEVQYSYFDETSCTYEGIDRTAEPTRESLDWFDPLGSAVVFGVGVVVVVAGAALAVRAVVRGAAAPDDHLRSTDRRAQ